MLLRTALTVSGQVLLAARFRHGHLPTFHTGLPCAVHTADHRMQFPGTPEPGSAGVPPLLRAASPYTAVPYFHTQHGVLPQRRPFVRGLYFSPPNVTATTTTGRHTTALVCISSPHLRLLLTVHGWPTAPLVVSAHRTLPHPSILRLTCLLFFRLRFLLPHYTTPHLPVVTCAKTRLLVHLPPSFAEPPVPPGLVSHATRGG